MKHLLSLDKVASVNAIDFPLLGSASAILLDLLFVPLAAVVVLVELDTLVTYIPALGDIILKY